MKYIKRFILSHILIKISLKQNTGLQIFSHIKTGGKDDISLEKFYPFTEFVLQVCIADVLGRLAQLTKYLLESSHTSYYRTCKYIVFYIFYMYTKTEENFRVLPIL